MDRLFDASFHGWWQNVLVSASKDVAAMDRKAFEDASIGNRLEEIAKRHSFDVARIDRSNVVADPREEEFQASDYGRSYTAKRKWLDVKIPFSGNPDSFRLAPSRCAVISQRIAIGSRTLTLSVIDDQNAQREVETTLTQLDQNLSTLRQEYDQARPQLDGIIQSAAETRKQQIVNETELDKGRTFKVNR